MRDGEPQNWRGPGKDLAVVEPRLKMPGDVSTITAGLEARRDGQDKNGRLYTIAVSAQDNAGNASSSTTTVIVPQDQEN